MSGFMNKLKNLTHRRGKSQGSSPANTNDNQSFSIQPHPAKTNDPADLQQAPGMGGGLKSDPVGQAHHARDPHVPSAEIMRNIEQPATREELKARGEELNR